MNKDFYLLLQMLFPEFSLYLLKKKKFLFAARTFLEQLSGGNRISTPHPVPPETATDSMDVKCRNINVLVTSGALIPSLVKCLLFRLDDFISHENGQLIPYPFISHKNISFTGYLLIYQLIDRCSVESNYTICWEEGPIQGILNLLMNRIRFLQVLSLRYVNKRCWEMD